MFSRSSCGSRGRGRFLGSQLKGLLSAALANDLKQGLLCGLLFLASALGSPRDNQQEIEPSRATHAFVIFICAGSFWDDSSSGLLCTLYPSPWFCSIFGQHLFEVLWCFFLLGSLKIKFMSLVFILLAVLYAGKLQNEAAVVFLLNSSGLMVHLN